MTASWSKVGRDLWRERTRAAFVILSIAIGLSGFLAVLSAYAILRRELDRGYLATNPASAVLVTDAIDADLLAAVIARDDVSDADARRLVSGRLRAGPSDWRHLTLFVIRDFGNLHISAVTSDGGAWPPGPGDVLIERDAFKVARADVGDVVTIRLGDGPERQLRVAGAVHDAGQAQARMENIVYGYIAQDTLAALGESASLDRLYVLAEGNRFDPARVQAVANGVKSHLESAGHPVRRMDVPTPGQHPHGEIMGALLLGMAAFGMFALVLSGVIVVNLLLAMMAAERRQIGVMQAIGGTRGQIGRVYLAEAALLGVAAVVLAIAPGIVAGRVLSRRFGVLLNFDLASLAIPPWIFLLVGVVGLIVPLAAAAYPVWSATSGTVRAALADVGMNAATFGQGRIDRMLGRIGGAARPLLLGVRNSLRRRTRTVLTLMTLACAGAFFISALSVRASMMAAADRRFGAGTYGAEVRYAFDQHMLMFYVFLLIVSGVLAAIGGLGLMTATSLNVLERRREIGVLRAIGASPAMAGAIVVIEAVFVSLLACLVAVIAAWPITSVVARFLTATMFPRGIDISLATSGVLGWVAISTTLAIVSSLASAVRVSRRPIREGLSYE